MVPQHFLGIFSQVLHQHAHSASRISARADMGYRVVVLRCTDTPQVERNLVVRSTTSACSDAFFASNVPESPRVAEFVSRTNTTLQPRILPTARMEVEPAARPLVQAVVEPAAEPLVQVVAQREAQRSQAQAAVRRSDSQRVVERGAQLEAQFAEYRCVPVAEPLPGAQPGVHPDAPLEVQSEARAEERPYEVQPVQLPTLRQRTDGTSQQVCSVLKSECTQKFLRLK